MNRLIKYFIFSFSFVVVGLLVGFKIKDNFSGKSAVSIDNSLRKLERVLSYIEENHIKKTDHQKLVDDAIKGMINGLGPHSHYFSAKEMQAIQEEMTGGFDGIGIGFDIVDDTIYVESSLPGGPSEKLGIMAGDRIVTVNDEVIAGIGITNADVYRYLKGKRGSKVKVGIFRRGHKELIDFNITRDRIPTFSVRHSYLLTPETGYIKVDRFANTTYREFKDHLKNLREKGMQNLILDLRGNPGGYFMESYKMADEFLASGKMIVSTAGRIAATRQEYKATSALRSFEKGPLIILIDYNSASASEIVSGAVQDHDRGLIVGVRSFGKGLVQDQEELEDGSAIRIVISEYYTPSGRSIQKPYDKTSEEYDKELANRIESGEIFDESKISYPDSLKYKTASGRTVYGGGGIYPDIFVAADTTGGSEYLFQLRMNDIFREFAFNYVDTRPNISEKYPNAESFVAEFSVDQDIVKNFQNFASDKGVAFDEKGFQTSQVIIENYIKAFIGSRMYSDDAFFPVFHQLDNVVQEAVRLVPKAKELEATGHFSEAMKN